MSDYDAVVAAWKLNTVVDQGNGRELGRERVCLVVQGAARSFDVVG